MSEIDNIAWRDTHVEDLWIFDKLILAKRLGHICGPKGVSVPRPGLYIVRPCVNFIGMSAGAELQYIEKDTDDLIEDGYFWCEFFGGRHLSTDYKNKKQTLCVEGFRKSNLIYKWSRWEKVSDTIGYPIILNNLKGNYEWVNVESIGRRIIEIHFRLNPNFQNHKSDYIIPVWKGDNIEARVSEEFIPAKEANRLGFYIKKDTKI